jgi:hypothetical protein
MEIDMDTDRYRHGHGHRHRHLQGPGHGNGHAHGHRLGHRHGRGMEVPCTFASYPYNAIDPKAPYDDMSMCTVFYDAVVLPKPAT